MTQAQQAENFWMNFAKAIWILVLIAVIVLAIVSWIKFKEARQETQACIGVTDSCIQTATKCVNKLQEIAAAGSRRCLVNATSNGITMIFYADFENNTLQVPYSPPNTKVVMNCEVQYG